MENMKIMDQGRYIIALFLKNVHHTHIENAYFPKPDNPTASNVTRLEQVEYLKTSTNEWIYGL